MESASVVGSTGCDIPCNYNQYKFLNIDMKPDEEWPVEGQIQYGLWAVTKFTKVEQEILLYPLSFFLYPSYFILYPFTKVEQEILLYPFTSLLAEFGGALGLFLGFSMMTIWDGVEGVLGHVSLFQCLGKTNELN